MSLILDGTNGLSDVDGSAATPAIRGSDANTGVFFGTDIVGVSTGGTERMRVDASGNVGIGTSSPGVVLNVVGATGIRVRGANSASSGALDLRADNTACTINANTFDAAVPLVFQIATTERMRIDSSGNLLVGATSAAGERFAVYNTSTSQVTAIVRNNQTSSTATDIFQIQSAQAAGSGYHLQRAYSNGVVQFAVRGDGVVFAQNTTIQSLSDIRTKENVRNADDGLQTVLGLRPVRFDFKEGFGNNRKNQLGFIAQEVEEVFPDAVDAAGQTDGNGDPYKSVGPGAIIPVLVKAIQELKGINDAQAQIITALTARVEALEGAQA
jgi:hypothetical protein